MAVSFKVPKSPERNIFNIDEFLGVDMTNSGTNVDDRMSPNAPNMIREVPGKVRKRMGYKMQHNFGSGVVYGAHVLKSTSTNTGDFVTDRNMSVVQNVVFNLDPGQSEYIYTDIEIPYGMGVHIQFTYRTNREFTISPYVTDTSLCTDTLNTLNTDTNYKGSFGFGSPVYEPYNAFKITNTNLESVTIDLKNIVVFFTQNDTDWFTSYKSYQTVNEQALFTKGDSFTFSDATEALSDLTSETANVTFSPNTENEKGLLLLSFDIEVSGVTDATLESLKVTYGVTQVDSESVSSTNVIPTFEYSTARKITVLRVIDPAYDHNAYVINSSYLNSINIEIKVTNYTTWSANVALKNFKATKVTLSNSFFTSGGKTLIHIDNFLYARNGNDYSLLSSEMNLHKSQSWQFENRLFIVDGNTYWIYDGENDVFEPVLNSSYAKIPLTRISCSPDNGSGTSYDEKNLMSYGFEQRFLVDSEHSTATIFQLMWGNLTEDLVTAKVMNSSGVMQPKVEGTDFSVDRITGRVTFVTAPGVTPVSGEDNVYITAYHIPDADSVMSVPECINKCTIGTLFGVNGATDRLFLSGNPEHPNIDWHSGQYDPTYFPDTYYSKLGRDTSSIVGYSMVNNYLAVHKDEKETEQSVFVREGDLITTGEKTGTEGQTIYVTEPAFKLINTLQGPGAIATYTFGNMQTEPLFLTRSGIFAITAQDITGEKYAQNRSFYINGALTKENGLEDAHAIVYKDMYFLFINNNVYVLDGLQTLPTAKDEPYATRQYVCFYLTNLPINVAWIEDNVLWFGTTTGKICSFYTDETNLSSYNDDGNPIEAWWETADLDGRLFYKNKTFRYVALRLISYSYSKIKIWAKSRGIWTKIKEQNFSNEVFRFSTLCFSRFTFNNDTSDPVMSSKLRVKKIDKARFKVENSNVNEPFGLHDLALEYVENGNFKG